MDDEYYDKGTGSRGNDFTIGFFSTLVLGIATLIISTAAFPSSLFKMSLWGTIIMLIFLILNTIIAITFIIKRKRRFIGIGMIVPIAIITIISGGCSSLLN